MWSGLRKVSWSVAGGAWSVMIADWLPMVRVEVGPKVTLMLASMGAAATVSAVVMCSRRPEEVLYRLGYEAGRRDAIRDMNAPREGPTVTRLRSATHLPAQVRGKRVPKRSPRRPVKV